MSLSRPISLSSSLPNLQSHVQPSSSSLSLLSHLSIFHAFLSATHSLVLLRSAPPPPPPPLSLPSPLSVLVKKLPRLPPAK
ncbi:unnamed protein product [Arctogadus glacialis]